MSSKISGRVWDLALPHAEQYVLLAMADHADHEGRNVRPSVGLIAWKTGYSDRQVQRIIQRLRERGVLVPDGFGPDGQYNYLIDLAKAPAKTPYTPQRKKRLGGDILTPPTGDILTPLPPDKMSPGGTTQLSRGGGDKAESRGGDIAMSPDPSLTVIKPPQEEEETPPLPPMDGSATAGSNGSTVNVKSSDPATIVALQREGILVVEEFATDPAWVVEAAAADTRLPPGHPSRPAFIVKRLRAWRAGTWSPPGARTQPPSAPPPSGAAPQPGDGIWRQVLDRLRAEIPAAQFTTWLEPTQLLDLDDAGAIVGCPNVFVRERVVADYQQHIATALQQQLGHAVVVQVEIGDSS